MLHFLCGPRAASVGILGLRGMLLGLSRARRPPLDPLASQDRIARLSVVLIVGQVAVEYGAAPAPLGIRTAP